MKKASPILTMTLLLACPFTAYGQEVQRMSLDQAIEMAIINTPRLRTAAAEIDKSRAMRGESWEIAPTSVEYAHGQLNGITRSDHQISVTQSFGSLLTPFYKNVLVNAQINSGMHFREMVKREIIAEVKRAWTAYLYSQKLCDLYSEQSRLADELFRIGQLRYEQGDITLLQRNMSSTMSAEMKNRYFQAQQELSMATERLKWVCYSDVTIVPRDTFFVSWTDPITLNAELSTTYTDYFNSLTEQQQARVKVEKSRLFPEISVGYVRQNILPDKGLNSWMVGASFPIFFNTQQSRIKQAKVDTYIAQNNAADGIRALNNKMKELTASIQRYQKSIKYYESWAMPEAEALVRSAEAELKNSETDISQYIQSMNAALEIHRSYAEALYMYNLSVLEYELYK